MLCPKKVDRQVLAFHPDSLCNCHSVLGETLCNTGYFRSILDFAQSLGKSPRNWWLLLGCCKVEMGFSMNSHGLQDCSLECKHAATPEEEH